MAMAMSKWGFQIGDTEPHFKEFKLGLNKRKVNDSHVEKRYPDPCSLLPNAKYPAMKLSADYLRELRTYALAIIKTKLGSAVVDNTPIECTLTVPAIWNEADKATTRSVAKQAGFPGKIKLVREPDAAMTYALEAMDPNLFKIGDTYTIALLNRVFGEYIRDNLSDLEGWDEDMLDEALDRFETVTRRAFDRSSNSVLIPVPGLVNHKKKGIVRGKYSISGDTLRDIFEPCVCEISALVRAQLQQTTGKVSTVLLVGGFGQNPYLREVIKSVVEEDIKVLQPPKGWTAVVEGGLIMMLNENIPGLTRLRIGSRKARKAYGITTGVPFIVGKHQKKRKYFDEFNGIDRVQVVQWLVNKGDELKEDEPITIEYFHTWATNEKQPNFWVDIFAFESETGRNPPIYQDQGARRLATLNCNLGSTPRRRLTTQLGSDGFRHYRVDVEVPAKLESAHIDYSLWCEGRCYGSVEAQYD